MRVVVLDLETTGLDPKVDRILEVGMVALEDGRKVADYEVLVDPGVPLRPANVAIHGITAEMVRGAPRLADVLDRIEAFLGEDPMVVGHSVAFDIGFLDAAFRSLRGRSFQPRSLDTQTWAREVFPGDKALSVERLVNLFGLQPRQYHRALADAQALADIYPLLERAYRERLEGYRSRFGTIDMVAREYLDVQQRIEALRVEDFTLRRTLELYLEEAGAPALDLPGEVRFRLERRESVEYQADELKEVLADAGLLARVAKVDKPRLDRLLRSERLGDELVAAIMRTRRVLSVRQQLMVDRLPAEHPEDGPWPTTHSPI
ncbi:MAG: 3'-5' exonuclease [Candidatus Sericytochromatia bacterium]|nr:3'-5' exonuclease [Candidatus Sericytochromatia bacterium]